METPQLRELSHCVKLDHLLTREAPSSPGIDNLEIERAERQATGVHGRDVLE